MASKERSKSEAARARGLGRELMVGKWSGSAWRANLFHLRADAVGGGE